jgi:hypothetical protein
MFSDYTHPSESDTPESNLRFGIMLAELWHDWFDAMSELAYRTHRACEFVAENGGLSNGRHRPFDFRPPHGPSEGLEDSIDMDRLKQCLQSMDPMQAARVMHAVQMMQAMEVMARRRRSRASDASRANEAEGAAW